MENDFLVQALFPLAYIRNAFVFLIVLIFVCNFNIRATVTGPVVVSISLDT